MEVEVEGKKMKNDRMAVGCGRDVSGDIQGRGERESFR